MASTFGKYNACIISMVGSVHELASNVVGYNNHWHYPLGPIVRINPYELHVNDPGFYHEIYSGSHRKRNKYAWQVKSGNSALAMGFTVSHELHRLRRGALDPYYSKSNVLKDSSIIEDKAQKFCALIETCVSSGQTLNLTDALVATTTDIISIFAFNDCFNLLDSGELTAKWRRTVTSVMKSTALTNHFGWIPHVVRNLPKCISRFIAPDLNLVFEYKSVSRRVLNHSFLYRGSRVTKDFK